MPPRNSEAAIREADVVLVCGVSGSGKTHMARRLEAEGRVRLSSDALLWELCGDSFAEMPPQRRAELFASVGAMLDERLDAMLAAGSRVAVDAPLCKRAARDMLRRTCSRYGASCVTVFMDAPLPLLLERLAARRGSGPDDQTVSPAEAAAFFAGFERPDGDEHAVTVECRAGTAE